MADEEGGAALPLAVVSGVNTTVPRSYYVHADHLNRPVMMTDAAKSTVWSASYLPFGGEYQITGTASFDARFPGQWYQLESGLSYNWHRQYDASLGRYIQPDPLGFVDGPNRYADAVNSPLRFVDPEGLQATAPVNVGGRFALAGFCAAIDGPVPLGDLVALGILGGTVIQLWMSNESDTEFQNMSNDEIRAYFI